MSRYIKMAMEDLGYETSASNFMNQYTSPQMHSNSKAQTTDQNIVLLEMYSSYIPKNKLHDSEETEINVAGVKLDENDKLRQIVKPSNNPSIIYKLKKSDGTSQKILEVQTESVKLSLRETKLSASVVEKTDKHLSCTNANEKPEGEFQTNSVLNQTGIKNCDVEMYKQRFNNESTEHKNAAANYASNDKSNKIRANTEIAKPILIDSDERVKKQPFLDKDADTYGLERFKKNKMKIFNHEKFLDGTVRLGTAQDEATLRETFEKFRFEVETHTDLDKEQLLTEMRQFGQQKFDDYGCICVAIMTHGSDHGYLKASDVRYSEQEVFECFNTEKNTSLVGKPIIFLIQACRGEKFSIAVPVQSTCDGHQIEADTDIKKESTYESPTEADLIIFHSCFVGKASGRMVGKGTWFIQTVCEQLNLYGSTEHLEDIFRSVRRIIALEKGSEYTKQMPVVTTSSLRQLYLFRNEDSGSERIDYNLNIKRSVRETQQKIDANLDVPINKLYVDTEYYFIGAALTVLTVACSILINSSLASQYVYFFTSAFSILTGFMFVYLYHYNVSWPKIIVMLPYLFIFLNIIGINDTWSLFLGRGQQQVSKVENFEFSELF